MIGLKDKPLKILIIKNRALGDSVIGLPSISYIKSILTNAKVFYGLPNWIIPLYREVSTDADGYFSIDLGKFSEYFSLIRNLNKEKFDYIIELHQSGRTRKFFNLYSKISGIPYVYHNHNLKLDEAAYIFDQGVRKPIIQRDLDTAYSFITKKLKLESFYPSYLDFTPTMNIISEKDNSVVFGIVATREEKKWPIVRFVELAKRLNQQIIIPISPSSEDQELKSEFGLIENVQFIERPLNELPGILSRASLYIGNDTGLKHICVALGLKTLTVFGPEEPIEWHPYDSEKHPFLWIHKYKNPICLLKQFDNSVTLSEITVDAVLAEISQNK